MKQGVKKKKSGVEVFYKLDDMGNVDIISINHVSKNGIKINPIPANKHVKLEVYRAISRLLSIECQKIISSLTN